MQELTLDIGGEGLLGKALILELCLEIRQVGLGSSQLGRILQAFLLDLRAAEFPQDCTGTDRLAGPDEASLDTSSAACRDDHHGLGHRGADAAHLPHLTASAKTPEASVPGTAGSMRDTVQARAKNATEAADPATVPYVRFRRAYPMRCLSMRRSA